MVRIALENIFVAVTTWETQLNIREGGFLSHSLRRICLLRDRHSVAYQASMSAGNVDVIFLEDIPTGHKKALAQMTDSVAALKETGRLIQKLFQSAVSEHTHFHLSGDWREECENRLDAITEAQLKECFELQTYYDSYFDTKNHSLSKGNMWLRLRTFHGGEAQWSLKHSIQRTGDKLQYEEVIGGEDILKLLSISYCPELGSVSDKLRFTFPLEISHFGSVRITTPDWAHNKRAVYFEVAELSPKHYYALLTYCSLVAPRTCEETNIVYSPVMSPVMACIGVNNPKLFDLVSPGFLAPYTLAKPPVCLQRSFMELRAEFVKGPQT